MKTAILNSGLTIGETPSDFATQSLFGGESSQRSEISEPDWLNNAVALASLNGPSKSEVDDVMRLWIETQTAARAMKAIDCLIDRAKTTKLPGGIRLSGEGGTGKTFILHRILKKYRAVDNGFQLHCPVIYIRLEKSPSPAWIISAILKAIGDTLPHRSSDRRTPEERVAESLRHCGVLLILVDEAQNLFPASGPRRNRERLAGNVAETVKILYDLSGVAIVWTGLPSFDAVFRNDSQLGTRWPGAITLPQFDNSNEWMGVLKGLSQAVDGVLGYRFDFDLYSPSIAAHMHRMTGGNFRVLKNLLSEMIRIASVASKKSVGMAILEQAVEQLALVPLPTSAEVRIEPATKANGAKARTLSELMKRAR